MGPDLQTSGPALRCPTCAAAVRPDAPWCTQCYADLRPAPEPEPVHVVRAGTTPPHGNDDATGDAAPTRAAASPDATAAASPDATAAAAPDATAASWPCLTCRSANPLDVDACRSCGAGFLSALRGADQPLLVVPVVGDLGALSRGQRLGLAAGVVVAVVLAVLLLGLLLA